MDMIVITPERAKWACAQPGMPVRVLKDERYDHILAHPKTNTVIEQLDAVGVEHRVVSDVYATKLLRELDRA